MVEAGLEGLLVGRGQWNAVAATDRKNAQVSAASAWYCRA